MTIPEQVAFLKALAAKAKGDDKAKLLEVVDVLMKARFAQSVPHKHGLKKISCPLCQAGIVVEG